MNRCIVSPMMDGRKTIKKYLPLTIKGLGTLWRLLIEKVCEYIKVRSVLGFIPKWRVEDYKWRGVLVNMRARGMNKPKHPFYI
jgi:hypothetical protein